MRKLAFMAIILISAACLGFAQEPAKMPEPKANDVKYTDASFARLSFFDGKAFIQRASDLAYEDLLVNTPIAAGDRIGTAEGRVEISLGRRNFLRLDGNTKIDVLALPRRDGSLTRLRGWAGSVYLDINGMAKEKEIEFLTSDATFYFLENGVYRIDIRENRETEILVFSGVVEASGEEGSALVKKGQKLAVSDGRFQGQPSAFFAAPDDAFDRFNDDREAKVGREVARKYLSGELEDYEGELDENGDWVYENPFGYVWIPRGMAAGWMPYTYGRWTWLPMAGWCWLPYEPWGWSTYHYGRWQWDLGLGWFWIPMAGWGPGWVDWWWDNDYYGWAPMSYWGYPGVIIDNFYYGRGYRDYGSYPIYSRALTVVRKDQLTARDVRSVALKNDALRSIGRMSFSGQAPDVNPSSNPRISTESLGAGGRVILRNGGGAGGASSGDTSAGGASKDGQSARGGDRKIDPKSGSASGTGATVDTSNKGESAPPERRIRRRVDESGSAASGGNGGTGLMGYPSRIADGQGSVGRSAARQDSGSVLDRLYRSITGGNGTSSSHATSSSSGGSSSVSSAPKAMPRISSSTSSSSHGSSGSSSSGHAGGSAGRKK
jgi:hypothetical protein